MNRSNIVICPGSTKESGAILSPCGSYRYFLWRRWSKWHPTLEGDMSFIMLNPSTADALKDDPTIRRCIGFAKRERCGGIQVVNLFAYRSPTPKDLLETGDPVGPENDNYIARQVYPGRPVILAWGSPNPKHRGRISEVYSIIKDKGWRVYCLGINSDGSPKHPLYLSKDAPIVEFPWEYL